VSHAPAHCIVVLTVVAPQADIHHPSCLYMLITDFNQAVDHVVDVWLVALERCHGIGVGHELAIIRMCLFVWDAQKAGRHSSLAKWNIGIALAYGAV
jgi:hypothetical protein